MILYHGTTYKRAQQIFQDRAIKKNCERFFSEEENGDGYSTDGYVYLTNEVTFALYFAYCHHRVDKSDSMVVFKLEIPDEMILPDYDEMRYQDPTGTDRARYFDDLSCSLLEFKACRVSADLSFDEFEIQYFRLFVNNVDNMGDLFDNAGCNYEYVTENYSNKQIEFIQSIYWMSV